MNWDIIIADLTSAIQETQGVTEYVCIYCGDINGGLKCEKEAEAADEAWKMRDD